MVSAVDNFWDSLSTDEAEFVQAIMAEAFFKAPERERKSNFVQFGEIEPHSKKERLVDGLLGALCRARRSVRAQKAARPRPRQRSGRGATLR